MVTYHYCVQLKPFFTFRDGVIRVEKAIDTEKMYSTAKARIADQFGLKPDEIVVMSLTTVSYSCYHG